MCPQVFRSLSSFLQATIELRMRSPRIVLSSRLNNWWSTEHYPNVWYDIDILAHPYAILVCSRSSWAINWLYPTMFIVFIIISDAVNKTWSSWFTMISHHVHCFHYLLHGKPWPGPSRSVHLVEKGFSIDSIGFCIFFLYICFNFRSPLKISNFYGRSNS